MAIDDEVHAKYELLKAHLRGRTRRLWAAAEAISTGRGGTSRVSAATGICTASISHGVRESKDPDAHAARGPAPVRVNGRPRIEQTGPEIVGVLERLLTDETAGDPMSDQRRARSSLRSLRARLRAEGYPTSPSRIAR